MSACVEVDATTEMMTVVVCDQGTPRVVKTPVSAAPMELTMSAVAEFTAVQGGLQLACGEAENWVTLCLRCSYCYHRLSTGFNLSSALLCTLYLYVCPHVCLSVCLSISTANVSVMLTM